MDFSLVDDPWIPVTGDSRKSLYEVFSEKDIAGLGGSPLEKIALFKLLLAISQAAYTPADEQDWLSLQPEGLASAAREYLLKWKPAFNLYGEKPFLQIPAISAAKNFPFQSLDPEINMGNTTVLFDHSREKELTDADRALLLLTVINFGFTGKLDNTVVLSSGYSGKVNDKGKPSTGTTSPALGYLGYLHTWLQSDSIWKTLWLNLWTQNSLMHEKLKVRYPFGVGKAPWESMPAGEDDEIAKQLKGSLLGRLVPLGRFCLIDGNEIHCSEGIAYPSYKNGNADLTCALKHSKDGFQALWSNPEKKPWRELTSLLRFSDDKNGFECLQSKMCLFIHINTLKQHGRTLPLEIWSGGLRVSPGTGKQYLSGTDDYVESVLALEMTELSENWLIRLKAEMEQLDERSKQLFACVNGYGRQLNKDKSDGAPKAAVRAYWENCGKLSQELVDACYAERSVPDQKTDETAGGLGLLHRKFYRVSCDAYDAVCPRGTSRQMAAWVKNRPGYLLKGK